MHMKNVPRSVKANVGFNSKGCILFVTQQRVFPNSRNPVGLIENWESLYRFEDKFFSACRIRPLNQHDRHEHDDNSQRLQRPQ